jgi:hypothetical protein
MMKKLIMVNLLMVFLLLLMYNTNAECNSACNDDLDCLDNNPIINETCISPGECNASCEYIIPKDAQVDEKNIKKDVMIKKNNIKINENINKVMDDNMTALIGTINLDKGITNSHFLFVINDPTHILTENIDRIHFNVEPFKVTEDAIIFLLEKNNSVYAIEYYIEPELSQEIIENTNYEETGLSEDIVIRKPSVFEKLYSIIRPDAYFSNSIIKMINALMFIGILVLSGLLVYFYIRKRNDSTEIKLLSGEN